MMLIKNLILEENFVRNNLFPEIKSNLNDLLYSVNDSFPYLIRTTAKVIKKCHGYNFDNIIGDIENALSEPVILQKLYKAVLELSVKEGVNLDKINKRGGAPLHFAVCETNSPLVSALLENGANVNIQTTDEKGYTALHFLIIKNNLNTQLNEIEILNKLLKHGIDLSITGKKGETALDLAKENKNINPELKARLEEAYKEFQKNNSATLFLDLTTSNSSLSPSYGTSKDDNSSALSK